MKNITKILAVAVAAVAISQSAHATAITGGIALSGSAVVLNGSTVQTSSEVLSWGPVTAASGTGSFSGVSGATTMGAVPWLFNAAESSFWSVGGFTFNLTTAIPQTPQFEVGSPGYYSETIFLAGTVSGNSYNPTAFSGSFSIQDPATGSSGNGYTFSGSFTFFAAPDGGTTALMLGSALSGLALIRRKLNV
jgi:hypothetical protein